ncbi:helicase C-terminal domain-containing protein [Halobacteriovorax sp. HLS]|uniref:helicase C-terminal domain-containing protein n=1 Tax=Halobacteriovorax sp. HLS TaxID=2234000 RepID=UPI000FD93645|nr:helicase C-terminal domain-containing protein [Halobacteriovorax sp. HLS]
MTHPLGKWAVIDIETTGIDPSYDQIIDVGFLQFDGVELVRSYSSLVQYEGNLSQFIKKLTGIDSKMLKNAPSWKQVEPEVMELFGHHLIAHNAGFEKSFLAEHFNKIDDGTGRETYEDSLFFLSLMFPQMSSLKLENFICDWGIADHEEHRGFQDSVDLLKVMLITVGVVRRDRTLTMTAENLFKKYNLTDYWYYNFFCLEDEELESLAKTVELDLEKHISIAWDALHPVNEKVEAGEKLFSLDFSGENLKSIFRDVDSIKKKTPFYRYRESQETLALKVGQSFKNKVHSLVQAPTGTGKTLGYMIPATLFSLQEQKQVLVATGTKTLQHQAVSKDVPQLRKLLGLDDSELKVRQLVGSGNHLCELLFRQSIEEEDLLTGTKDFEAKFTDMFFDLVFFHNSRAHVDDQITRGDLPFVIKMKFKEFESKEKDVTVDFRSCTGQSCPFKSDCSYIKGLREAKDADIIVGNHALMFSWPRSFPRPQYVVVDEAHKVEGETTSAFTFEVTQDDLFSLNKTLVHSQGIGSLFYLLAQNEKVEGESTAVITQIRARAQDAQQSLADHLQGLPTIVESFFKKRPKYTDIFWNESPMVDKKRGDELSLAIFNHLDSIRFIISDLNLFLLPYHSRWDVKELTDENQIVAFTRFEKFVGGLEDIQKALEIALGEPQMKPGYTRSIKYHGDRGFCVSASPVNVGKVLHDGLLEISDSVVFTSATLGNAKGDQGAKGIEWATGYSYLSPEKRFKGGFFLPPTFDYENKTKVYLCDDTLPIWDQNFVPQTLEKISKLIRDLGGRSLLLFSARSRFEVAREILLEKFEGELPLFIQGMGNNVVEDFKNSTSGILLGMESFGEGIDIPGDALQFVFVDKIPDLRMDLVIQDRRDFYESNLGNEFTDYYLAHRTRSLHQKLGRLLRTESDIGGVIVVDSRIRNWKGRTMEKLLKLMEPYKLQRTNLNDACDGIRDFVIK